MMKQGVIGILLLAFLGFVRNSQTALADMGKSPPPMSYETVGIMTVATIVVLFGIPYLMNRHKKRSQEKEQEEDQNHATSFNAQERISTNGETVIWCW
jgi:hypothetical protein